MDVKELKEKQRVALLAARAICDEAEKANRDFTPDERQKVAGYMAEAKALKDQIAQAEGDADIRRMVAEFSSGMPLAQTRGGTIGEQFAGSEAYKGWLTQIAPGGQVPDSAKGLHSPVVEFKSFFPGRKTLITAESDTSAGAFITTDNTGIYEPLGRQALTVRGLIGNRTTQSDTVSFVRQTAKVTQATPVAEANVTDYTGATGEVSGEKPEAAIAFERVTTTVKTIAVWIPATKAALSDASQVRGIIDGELRADLEEELEDQIINGDGTGENFTGLLNTSGILTQAWDTDIFTTTRKAKTYLRTTGRARPTAWLMNPEDFESLDLTKDAQDRYYYGGPLSEGQRTLWGVPIVESETVTAGQAILGEWSKAVMWDRERATLQVSDSHADFFIRNMVAFLAEMRAAFGVIRPSAFCVVEMTAGS